MRLSRVWPLQTHQKPRLAVGNEYMLSRWDSRGVWHNGKADTVKYNLSICRGGKRKCDGCHALSTTCISQSEKPMSECRPQRQIGRES